MPSSIVKYAGRAKQGDQNLFWTRVQAGEDSAPFRGAFAPMFRDEEYEARAVRVVDARNAFFDMTKPEERQQYLDVVDCILNGWFRLVHMERFWVDQTGHRTTLHYVEWAEFYMEDGTRTPFSNPLELGNGLPNVHGHP